MDIWVVYGMRVVISPLYGIGDTIMTFPAVEILKKSKPDWHITYVTFDSNIEKILSINPYIDNVLYLPLKSVSKIKASILTLKNLFKKFDITINFFPSNRLDYNIFSLFTFSKVRVGHTYLNQNLWQLNFLKNKTIREDYSLHCVEENIKLLSLLGIKPDYVPKLSLYLNSSIIEDGKSYIRNPNKIRIGIHPGSSKFKNHENRRWGVDKFLSVINAFPEFDFYILGSKEEKKEIEFLSENSSNTVIIYDKDIIEVAGIISNLNLFISNDSGLMHIASACGVPVIGIFGPTNPVWVRPWNEPYRVVRLDIECSPCFVYSPKPLTCKSNKNFECLKELHPDLVIKAVKELINA